jgi:putative acetyltransferase
LESIVQLFCNVVHAIGPKYYTREQIDAWAPQNRDDQEEWMKSLSENITYVVEEDYRIVAFGDMTLDGFIDRLYVDKNYQGRGIASSIFQKFEEDARKLGLTQLTMEANIIIKPLAERRGFEVVREHRKMRRGAIFINYIMRKIL